MSKFGAQNALVRKLRVWFHQWFKLDSKLVPKDEVTVSAKPWLHVPVALRWARAALWKVLLPCRVKLSHSRSFLQPLPDCQNALARGRKEWAGQDLPFGQQQGPKSNSMMAKLHLNFPYWTRPEDGNRCGDPFLISLAKNAQDVELNHWENERWKERIRDEREITRPATAVGAEGLCWSITWLPWVTLGFF